MFLCRKKLIRQYRETQPGNTKQQQRIQLELDNKKFFFCLFATFDLLPRKVNNDNIL